MAYYQPLFSVDVTHGYFLNQSPSLVVKPTTLTARYMNNYHLLLRTIVNGFVVFFDQDQIDVLKLHAQSSEESLMLNFLMSFGDDYFNHYTDPACSPEDSGFFLSHCGSWLMKSTDAPVTIPLHDSEYVSESELTSIESVKKSIKENIKFLPGMVTTIVSIGVDLASLEDESRIAPAFRAQFAVKKTRWKYLLLGLESAGDLTIKDTDQQITFLAQAAEKLMDGRVAQVFISDQLIPLRRSTEYRFELIQTDSRGAKTLMRPLPVACAAGLNQMVIDGQTTPVSEIFINY